jgi:hypothetical protein
MTQQISSFIDGIYGNCLKIERDGNVTFINFRNVGDANKDAQLQFEIEEHKGNNGYCFWC